MPRSFALLVLALAVLGGGAGATLLFLPVGDPGSASQPPVAAHTGHEAVHQPGSPPPPDPNPDEAARRYAARERAEYFMTFGPGALWAFAVMLMFAVWFGAIGYGLWRLRDRYRTLGALWQAIRRPAEWDWIGIAWGALLCVVVFAPSLLGRISVADTPVRRYIPTFGYEEKQWVILSFSFLASLTFLILLRRVDRAACQENVTLANAAALLADLRRSLLALGVMVSLVALGTAAMRTGLNQLYGRDILRLEADVAYGLYYTFALAVVYAPVHLRVTACARRAVEAAYPGEPDPAIGLPPAAVHEQREAALRRIGLGGWEETFRSSVMIFSPLLTTVVALVLPSK